jgi:RecB family endonuclease NucS
MTISGSLYAWEFKQTVRSLLRSNGFELTRVIPTASMLSIIEAVKL